MDNVIVKLTDDEMERMSDVAKLHGAKPGELLAAFVADLVCSGRTGGSDERMYANEWLDRQTFRWMDGELC